MRLGNRTYRTGNIPKLTPMVRYPYRTYTVIPQIVILTQPLPDLYISFTMAQISLSILFILLN